MYANGCNLLLFMKIRTDPLKLSVLELDKLSEQMQILFLLSIQWVPTESWLLSLLPLSRFLFRLSEQ